MLGNGMVFFALHPSGLILNAFALMPLRASSLCSSSEMHAHLVELGVRTNTRDDANKKPQLTVWCFWLSVVHPSRLILNTFVLMPLRASSLCSSFKMHAHLVELGVRSNAPDDANKKPQLKSWGLIFGAPGGIRTPDQVVRSHLLYPAELRVLEVL